jgi:hypothetical protein
MRGRIFGGAALLATAAALAGGGTASAGHPGGCPASFVTVSAASVGDTSTDKNGDGWICTKPIGGPPGTTVFVDVDNNAQGSNLP